MCLIKFVHYLVHVAGLPDDVDANEYPDDFEDEDELAEVVSCARNAMQTLTDESLELKDSDGPSVTMRTLREKYIGIEMIRFIIFRILFMNKKNNKKDNISDCRHPQPLSHTLPSSV